MPGWKNFEIRCADYLNDRFGKYANFTLQGGSDSTISDILVKTNSGNTFFMEAKQCPAQCGQFVLLPNYDTHTFSYSRRNTNVINSHSNQIIQHMNKSFKEYSNAGTSGKQILFPACQTAFTNWIIDAYQKKKVSYFIINNYKIIPIGQFSLHFDVAAKYREKRSGSDSVGPKRANTILSYLVENGYEIKNHRIENAKLFVISSQNIYNKRFIFDGFEYTFSQPTCEEYEIRKLSNTRNSNVIFSINEKHNMPGMSDAEFISHLLE